MFAVSFPLYWWFTVARDRNNFVAVSRILAVVVVFGLILAYGAGEIVGAFYGRAAASGDIEGRVL
jgi:hypothetical protein